MVPPELARWTICIANFNLITMAIRLCLRAWRISNLISCIISAIRWIVLNCRCLGIIDASRWFSVGWSVVGIFWIIGFYSLNTTSRFCFLLLFFFIECLNLFFFFLDVLLYLCFLLLDLILILLLFCTLFLI